METNNEKLNAIQAKLRKLQKMYEGAKSINSEGEADTEIGSKVNALVLRHNAAIDEYVKNTWGKTGTSHRSESNFYSARQAGYQAGRNTNVGRPISGARQAAANFKSLGC